jgi:hypothetical protein
MADNELETGVTERISKFYLAKIAGFFIYKSTSKNEYFPLPLRCNIKLSDRVGNSLCGSVEQVHPANPPILEAVAKKAT